MASLPEGQLPVAGGIFQKGTRLEAEILSLNHQGQGVTRVGDLVVFVDGGVPGDKAEIELTDVRRNYAVARITQLRQVSARRVEPFCGLYPACGGCQLQHVSYEAQLEHKRQVVVDALARIGGLRDVTVLPTIGMSEPWNYRNKAQYPVGRWRIAERPGERQLPAAGRQAGPQPGIAIGFYRAGTHEIIPVEHCHLQNPLNNRTAKRLFALLREAGLPAYDERTGEGLLRHILVRTNAAGTKALALVVTSGDGKSGTSRLPGPLAGTLRDRLRMVGERLLAELPEVVGVLWNVNPRRTNVILGQKTALLAGEGRMVDTLDVPGWGELKFVVSATAFYQVNPAQTSVLYKTALDGAKIEADGDVIDAYCGVGTMSLFAALRARRVWGIEESSAAVRDAHENQRLNGIVNATFIADKVENALPRLAAQGVRPNTIILDPPRAGCEPVVLDAIGRMSPERIVYVSCNPSTLARDLARLARFDPQTGDGATAKDAGDDFVPRRRYLVTSVQPVDMFPQTSHIEAVALVVRG